MAKQLEIEFEPPFENQKLSPKYWNVPFVDEVQEFNDTFGKPNNYKPIIGSKLLGLPNVLLNSCTWSTKGT